MSLLVVLDSVRSFRIDGRVAETTMRAVPDRRSGTLCLPNGCEIRRWFASVCVTAVGGLPSNVKSDVVRPSCSNAIVRDVNSAFGASAVTSSVPSSPATRSGFTIVN